jgi:hypothetical protein
MSFGPSSLYSIRIEEPEVSNSWFPSFSLFVDTDIHEKEYDKFFVDGHTYYSIPHNKEYRVRMINNSRSRVNATLTIDSEVMGVWRIEPFSDIVIERPSHNDRKFVFVEETSREAKMGGVTKGKSENGLVEVAFVPEKTKAPKYYAQQNRESQMYHNDNNLSYEMNSNMSNNFSASSKNLSSTIASDSNRNYSSNQKQMYSSGATVLGDDSNQRFVDADYIVEDFSKKIIKRVRLVVKGRRKPYTSIKKRQGELDYDGVYYDGTYDDSAPPRIDRRNEQKTKPRFVCDTCNHNDLRYDHVEQNGLYGSGYFYQ